MQVWYPTWESAQWVKMPTLMWLTSTHTHHKLTNTCRMDRAFYLKILVKVELEECKEIKIKWGDEDILNPFYHLAQRCEFRGLMSKAEALQ